MQVELLYHTPDPERAIATAARLCYSAEGAAALKEKMNDDQADRVLSTILANGHYSALEHASFTFAVDGVSRALTHQLVRHRIASYNQQSQRYVKYTKGLEVIKPPSVADNPEADALFDKAINQAEEAYTSLLEMGIPAEDARYLLPNATESKIVITMNARELLHFFEQRCCNRAQWEIRIMALAMLERAREVAPKIFADAGAPCVHGKCPEGTMSCGNPYPRARAC